MAYKKNYKKRSNYKPRKKSSAKRSSKPKRSKFELRQFWAGVGAALHEKKGGDGRPQIHSTMRDSSRSKSFDEGYKKGYSMTSRQAYDAFDT